MNVCSIAGYWLPVCHAINSGIFYIILNAIPRSLFTDETIRTLSMKTGMLCSYSLENCNVMHIGNPSRTWWAICLPLLPQTFIAHILFDVHLDPSFILYRTEQNLLNLEIFICSQWNVLIKMKCSKCFAVLCRGFPLIQLLRHNMVHDTCISSGFFSDYFLKTLTWTHE